MTQRIGIYPGTFDPITRGHLHIIERAAKLVDHLVVGVAQNSGKKPMFTLQERIDMAKADISQLQGSIEVTSFDNLLVDFAKQKDASVIFRGLRAVSDFDYEFQMTGMNARLAPEIETVFLMAGNSWQFVSSSFLKEIARFGGNIDEFVTKKTYEKILAATAQSG